MGPKYLQQKKSLRPSKRYIQSRLQIGGSHSNKLIKCQKCDMTYSPNNIDDTTAHKAFHETYLKGKKWSKNWGITVYATLNQLTPPPSQNLQNDRIVMVRPDHQPEVNATLEVMNIVNNELHAPQDENDFWLDEHSNGKAFLYIKDDRAVGAVTIEPLKQGRGRWMIYDSKKLVSNVIPNFEIGISRIWVCKSQRGKNIASKLLEASRFNTTTRNVLPKSSIAWSQPTDDGGKLALKYNSVRHKSGKILLPCYI
ncbi:N-acetyltransferase O1 (Establishment of cohesion protein 1) [Maudiozyma exigua]|uniref:N-acetyltransferase ECO1 n=1 Tax=Maudiozyma exigua TaxID=34358 RepID=A0A9P6WBH4_MAUEX|nr:N-acetyltransferase O1 (Establishment of cohesion protein 1) [Kazachstania exigua]